MSRVPSTVPENHHGLYTLANEMRAQIKSIANDTALLKAQAQAAGGAVADRLDGEVIANTVLAYRHLEDASMRLGKVLQALDGGVSVYDKATTVGAPENDGAGEAGGLLKVWV